ncbi:hypothetical protein ACF3M2_14065 [Tissierella carlieri]|uniref:hypothetical protein n=1 Tax=Tissierella carlieri TaxID=689904 RepID=UPI00386DB984
MKKFFVFAINVACYVFIPSITLYFKNKYYLSFWTYFIITFPLLMIALYFTRKLAKSNE